MSCEECRELNTHRFRSAEDLIHALQTAAMEMERGVLQKLQEKNSSVREDEALQSAFAAGALPNSVTYRFNCTLCGDRFALTADPASGDGAWTRNDEQPALSKPDN